ncbi:MAG: hypothetical protein FWD38_02105 [Oscillospiraceae bacterium]|nr:hypothetical protein [Oscillospiraceae bacterium]
MNKQRFADACSIVTETKREYHQIGTLGEKTLHAVVKHYIEPDVTKHEKKVGSFHADIVTENGIFEIQTRSFNALRKRLNFFLEHYTVTIVYPLPKTKWLLWIDKQTGEVSKKRKSPKTGRIYDAVHELYKIRPLLNHPNLKLHVVFIDMEEYRYLDGWSENKKKGSSRYDRHPLEITDEILFNAKSDYLQFIPPDLEEQFTTKDYKQAAKINLRTAQTILNILNYIGAVKRTGKTGNLHIYERNTF